MSDNHRTKPVSARVPKVITNKEIESMPRLEFNTGIETAIFISREREDARYFRQGICYAKADHQPINWFQANFDETQFCLSGKITLRVEDGSGKKIVLEAGAGEHIYLPAGFTYTLEANGADYTFFWVSGPSNAPGIVEAPDYSEKLRELRA